MFKAVFYLKNLEQCVWRISGKEDLHQTHSSKLFIQNSIRIY